MNEEELFFKLFPEYAVNGKPLSPYFDLFESGYEQLEKRIAELEKENAELKEKLGDVQMQKAGEKSDLVWKLKTANEQKAEQLTKAKDILNNFLNACEDYEISEVRTEAEQFLKDSKQEG